MLGIFSIIKFELSRFKRTLLQSLVVPIITTFLYLLVFGQAIGRSVSDYEINYALFIIPGVILLSVFKPVIKVLVTSSIASTTSS